MLNSPSFRSLRLITGALCGALLLSLVLPVHADTTAATYSVEIRARHVRSDGTDAIFPVQNGTVIRSGDEFQIRLESDRDVYLYVLIHSSSGNAELLHPFSGRASEALLKAGREKIVPGASGAFSLDDNIGLETIYVLASDEPYRGMQRLLDRIERVGGDRAKATDVMRSAGVSFSKIEFRHVRASVIDDLKATGLPEDSRVANDGNWRSSGSFFDSGKQLSESIFNTARSASGKLAGKKKSAPPPEFDRLFGGSTTTDPAAQVVLADVGSRIAAIFNPESVPPQAILRPEERRLTLVPEPRIEPEPEPESAPEPKRETEQKQKQR